jgi:hypothetical protein
LADCGDLPIGGEPASDGAEEQSRAQLPQRETPAQARGRELAALLDYYRGVQMAPRAVLEERSDHLADWVQEGECSTWRLKYAMVTKALVPPEGIPDARKHLDVCLAATPRADRALSGFAYLLEELWEAEAVSVQYRDQLQRTRQQLESEQSETAKLRKQLEGLKAIEKSIQQRDRDKGASGSQ